MKRGWIGIGLAATLMVTDGARARDLEEILREKGVITDKEAGEAKRSETVSPPPASSTALSVPDWLTKITPFGDVRIRNEVFFREGDPDRNRDRFRLRVGARVKVNDETELGFKLASGNASDPISNNQTFTDEFTFKNINIANAYLKLAPTTSLGLDRPWVTLMGGKFDVPLYVVPAPAMLVFDRDLTPEGFFESLKAIEQKDGWLRALSLNLGQWIFEENSNTGEAALYSFQGVASIALGDVLWNAAVGDYRYVNPSSIAVARNKNTALNVTNNVGLSDGTEVGGRQIDPTKLGPNKDGLDANGSPITIKRFISKFNDLDIGTDATIPTGAERWPLRLFFGYVKNTEASGGDDQGFEGGVTIGSSKDPGDVVLTYAYERLETDAVVSVFSESDFGHDGGTNTKGHIAQAGVVLFKNLSLLSTACFDKPIRDVVGRNGDQDVRWQVDLIAKF